MSLIARIFGRRRRYDDIAVSIREHIEERIDELMKDGMPQAEAEQMARREFGNPTLMEQRSREVWQWQALESLLADLKFTLRRLRKSPMFAATVLLTLSIGIGANTAVFSVVNSILLKPLPYPDSERLVALWLSAPGAGGLANFTSGLQLSGSMYLTFSQRNHSFDSMGIWATRNANVTGLAQPEQVQTLQVSDGILETLAVAPQAGRWFSAADQDPHGAQTVMLSYGYWQRRFGGDRSVVGHTIQVDSQSREIVGIMPRGFRVADQDFDLLVPLALDPAHLGLAGFGYNGIGRLRSGVAVAQAEADIEHLLPVWMDSWTNGPGTNPHVYEQWRIAPHFRLLKRQVIGNVDSVLWVVIATVGLVMLIACTNVANLMLVRAKSRQTELSIRAALGAGRGRIARELLIESITLGLMGGVFALSVAYGGLRLLVAIGPTDLPRLSEITFDARSFGFTFALSVFSGLFFGAIPALKYARNRAVAMVGTGNRTASTGRGRLRTRNVLVIAQVAMALVLLVSALLMIRTFAALRNVPPGFADARHIQTVQIAIPERLVPDARIVTRMQNDIVDNLAAIPGASSVGFAASVPMDGNDPNWDEVRVEGKVYSGREPPLCLYNYVSPGYFQAMGTHLLAGRNFTWTDIHGMRNEVMVSENFARENWGSAAAATGKRLHMFSRSPWQEVIGVVEDVHVHGVDEKAPAIVYWPSLLANPYNPSHDPISVRGVTFAVRSGRASEQGFLSQVQQAVWKVNGNLPLASVQTMQQTYGQSLARTSFTLVMLAIAGGMALALSVIGIYGVISYAVSQRTREIGIRLALGAQKGMLRWMFVRSALVLTGVGAAVGLLTAGMLTQLMRTLLFGISPLDPLTFVAVPIVIAASAAVASYLPAHRAAAVDPVEALRTE